MKIVFGIALIAVFSRAYSLPQNGKPLSGIAPRIVDGSDAQKGEFPSVVSLICGDLVCGGALVASQWVLTAAYCVYYCDENMIVQLGSVSLREADDDRLQVAADDGYLHPNYSPGTFWDNIALVRLEEPVSYTDAIKPIALYEGDFLAEGAEITITGWGSTDPSDAFDTIDTLQYGTATLTSVDKCEVAYGFATNTSLCTTSGASPCWRDYGSPAIVTSSSGEQAVVGVFAYKKNILRCVEPENYPGLFTRVEFFTDWIRNVTGLKDL